MSRVNITQYHVSGWRWHFDLGCNPSRWMWNGINYTARFGSKFVRASDSLKEYIVFKVDDVFPSSDITDEGKIANQNLHNVNFAPDFVIVSHPSFMNEARRLAGFHHDTRTGYNGGGYQSDLQWIFFRWSGYFRYSRFYAHVLWACRNRWNKNAAVFIIDGWCLRL